MFADDNTLLSYLFVRLRIAEVRKGGYVLYDSSWPLDKSLYRDDVNFLPIPFAQMCNDRFKDARARTLMKNIAYAGALVATLEIDFKTVEHLLDERFAGKKALRDSNLEALRIGHEGAKEKLTCPLPFHLEPMNANAGKVLIDGNTATALGCVYAGATVAACISHYPCYLGHGLLQGVLRKVPPGCGNR